MPYNTRRISLSLPSLGVQLPRAHRSPTTPSTPSDKNDLPPTKRIKRSHTLTSTPLAREYTPPPPPLIKSTTIATSTTTEHTSAEDTKPVANNTPPPSPPSADHPKLDYEGINDDIVIAVLQQLEKTGNRPHLIKELATILATQLKCVESSANPAAIISSRLTNYLKRPWTALAPCPLAKEQTDVHPRRVYFFLTTVPRQPIPEFANPPMPSRRIVSPSISSGFEEEEVEERKRDIISPSPEVEMVVQSQEDSHLHAISDLTFPMDDFSFEEEDDTLMHNVTSNNRAPSPPLEQDEKEFTQTATVMQMRKQSEQAEHRSQMEKQEGSASPTGFAPPSLSMSVDSLDSLDSFQEEEVDTNALFHNEEAAAMLFGGNIMHTMNYMISSPMLKPQQAMRLDVTPRKDMRTLDSVFSNDNTWTELVSPETIELSELDNMLDAF